MDVLWADRYKSQYTYDANGNIETAARFDGDGNMYDAMTYGHHVDANGRTLRNRPYNIQDLADQAGNYAQDIPQMAYQPNGIVDPQDANHTINTANNFSYDVLGQRIKDEKADIELIEWTATGKMKRVHHTTASGKPDITFAYDAAGNRIMKQVGDPDQDPATGYREHYVLDAQGNIMAVYKYTNNGSASLKVTERPVYGSKRLGSYTRAMELVGEQSITVYPYVQPMQAPLKHYELTDHLGNVAAVVTGRLLPLLGPGVQYQAEVVSAGLHEPFGLDLTGMNWHSNVSRFGFQNQIKDLELNAIHFKYREYFPSDGVFPSTDPLAVKSPSESPYLFVGGNPIIFVDPDGKFKLKYDAEALKKAGVTQQQVARFESIVRNISNLVRDNQQALGAISNTTGFSADQVMTDLSFGKGPTIEVTNYGPGARGGKDGIVFDVGIIKQLAGIDGADQKELSTQVLGTALTILHEYGHYGDQVTNDGENTGQFVSSPKIRCAG
ncbi:MAG: hypothetical protein KJZ58_05450 [Flavobacteriales bacterium]|nr:hypothetical protein [Flavobacteriales bacterium]